jgi:oligoendopeptidase F
VQNRSAPAAFAEVASHAMELIGAEHLQGAVYGRRDAVSAQLRSLGRVVRLLCNLARVESFQFWLHDHPHHGPRAREAAWSELGQRFEGGLDWRGLERTRGRGYLAHPGLLRDPFGQLPYAVALVGALQVWASYEREPQATLERFMRAMSLGWSRDLPGLFQAAGLELDFSRAQLEQLMRQWDRRVDRLMAQLDRVPRSPGISSGLPTRTEVPV